MRVVVKEWRLLLALVMLATGFALLATYGTAMLDRSVASQAALASFGANEEASERSSVKDEAVDFSLWSSKRIRAYRESLNLLRGDPMAVLAMDRLQIKAPVFAGTDELVLNRGLGWIQGTAKPGEPGNSGVAGHRDGFFRALKDVALGDAIEVRTRQSQFTYRVDNLEIVYPENVGVLRPRAVTTLTLVTCYPFYFAGDAPQRFIVQARLEKQTPLNSSNKE